MTPAVRAWVPAILFAALLYAASSRSTLPTDLSGGMDKVVHFAAYAVLGLLVGRAALASGWSLRWPILIGWLYAASDEVHQYFVPGRAADPADWVADALGVALACVVLYRSSAGRPRSRPAADEVSTHNARP